MLTTAIQVNLGMISLAESEVTKRLAAWAAIIAVPTMVAGIYGMNFEHMPELKWTFGYPLAIARDGRDRRLSLLSLQEDAAGCDAPSRGSQRERASAASAGSSPRAPIAESTRRRDGITRPAAAGPRRAAASTCSMPKSRASILCAARASRPRAAVARARCAPTARRARRSLPDVQVVHARHARQRARARGRSRRSRECAGTPSISTPVDCLSSASVERRISSATASDRIGSIGIQPVAMITRARDDRRERAQQVAHHVQQRAARVERSAPRATGSTRRRG